MSNKKEQIVIIGLGWVGQANALALSAFGYDVSYYDPGTPHFHYAAYKKEYESLKKLKSPLEIDSDSTCYIVCVGDKVDEAGNQDISLIKKALASLEHAKGTVMLRSTVRPDYLKELKFDIYMPEFLHEKTAVEECMDPHYVVVGKKKADVVLPSFIKTWKKRGYQSIECTPEEASHIKYLSNVWNAMRIAFVNEFGRSIHAQAKGDNDIEALAKTDKVLRFMFGDKPYCQYGRAYTGHCLPKDMRAYRDFSSKHMSTHFFDGIIASNAEQEAFQKKHHELAEWYSPWRRDVISGKVALKALVKATTSRIRKTFNI